MSGSPASPAAVRYVRADRLLPGDVFLSRGTDKDSNWIAWTTLGPFSHAAIYHSNHCLFESIDDGVGYTGLDIAKACRNPGHGAIVLLDVSQYLKLEIRRHPVLEQACATSQGRRDIEDRLSEWLIPKNGFEYPALTALARAVPYVPSFAVLPILWAVARFQGEPTKVVPGMFCSQLVASALEDLGAYPLKRRFFDRKISPEQISPNRLQSCRSRLTPVQGAIVDEDFRCDGDGSQQWFLDQLKTVQTQRLEILNKSRAQALRTTISQVDNQYRRIKELTERSKSIRK